MSNQPVIYQMSFILKTVIYTVISAAILKMLFTFNTMLVVLLQRIHLASGHCILGLNIHLLNCAISSGNYTSITLQLHNLHFLTLERYFLY